MYEPSTVQPKINSLEKCGTETDLCVSEYQVTETGFRVPEADIHITENENGLCVSETNLEVTETGFHVPETDIHITNRNWSQYI